MALTFSSPAPSETVFAEPVLLVSNSASFFFYTREKGKAFSFLRKIRNPFLALDIRSVLLRPRLSEEREILFFHRLQVFFPLIPRGKGFAEQ